MIEKKHSDAVDYGQDPQATGRNLLARGHLHR